MIQEAMAFAIERHGDQKYGDAPYSVHLESVLRIAREFELDRSSLIAAPLHDTLEDTETTREELCTRFGEEPALLVFCVTGSGPNRKARQKSIVEKLLAEPRAVNLKLCDRIANVEAANAAGRHSIVKMYRSEQPLYDAVFRQGKAELYARLLRAFQGSGGDSFS